MKCIINKNNVNNVNKKIKYIKKVILKVKDFAQIMLRTSLKGLKVVFFKINYI